MLEIAIFQNLSKSIMRENFSWLFAKIICCGSLPHEFVGAICCENLRWQFTVFFFFFYGSKSFLHLSRYHLHESKSFLCLSKTYLFVRFYYEQSFLFLLLRQLWTTILFWELGVFLLRFKVIKTNAIHWIHNRVK